MIKKPIISNWQLVIRSLATIVVLITVYYLPITGVSFAQEKCDPKNTEQYCLSVPLLDKQGKPIYVIPKGEAGIAQYVKTIYQFSLGIGALLAVAMIVFGGIEYTVSAGNVSKQQEARDRIINAIYGLALLMAAVLILFTINPNLVKLGLPTLESPPPPTSEKKNIYADFKEKSQPLYDAVKRDLEKARANYAEIEKTMNDQINFTKDKSLKVNGRITPKAQAFIDVAEFRKKEALYEVQRLRSETGGLDLGRTKAEFYLTNGSSIKPFTPAQQQVIDSLQGKQLTYEEDEKITLEELNADSSRITTLRTKYGIQY